MFDLHFAAEILPRLLAGAAVTLLYTAIGFVLAALLGLSSACFVFSGRSRAANRAIGAVFDFIRTTPMLVQLYMLFYGIGEFGILLPASFVAIFVITLHYGAYLFQVFLAGLNSIPASQREAAAALGLGWYPRWFRVLLPQLLARTTGPAGNYLIGLFKETPLLATITIPEMLFAAKAIGSRTFRYFEPMTIVGLIFLVMSLVAAILVLGMERQIRRSWFIGNRG